MKKFSMSCLVAVLFILLASISFAGGNPMGADCQATIPSSFQSGKENKIELELSFSGIDDADLSSCKVTATLQFGHAGSKLSKKFEGMLAKHQENDTFSINIWSSKPRKGYHVVLTDVRLETPEGRVYEFPEVHSNEAVVE